MVFHGQCNCGRVRATMAGPPVQVRQCWCRQCQKAAAGGPTHNAMFRTAEVSLEGDTTRWAYLAASGNTLTQHFCTSCGTPVCAQSSARPQFMTFRLGFLEGEHGLQPQMAIWTDEMPRWAVLDPALERHPGPPPVPTTG